jgi:hypothetical protein
MSVISMYGNCVQYLDADREPWCLCAYEAKISKPWQWTNLEAILSTAVALQGMIGNRSAWTISSFIGNDRKSISVDYHSLCYLCSTQVVLITDKVSVLNTCSVILDHVYPRSITIMYPNLCDTRVCVDTVTCDTWVCVDRFTCDTWVCVDRFTCDT